MGGTRAGRRVTMAEAAAILGVSAEAIRKRVQRGTIRSDKGTDGRRYVYVDTDRDTDRDGATSKAAFEVPDRTAELIATLREQLAAERRANEENRRIIAALTSRIPVAELEAPPPPPEAEPGSEAAEPRSDTPTDAAEPPRSWWRRLLA